MDVAHKYAPDAFVDCIPSSFMRLRSAGEQHALVETKLEVEGWLNEQTDLLERVCRRSKDE